MSNENLNSGGEMMRLKVRLLPIWLLANTLIYGLCSPDLLLSQVPYYEGKTLKVIRGGSPGGTGDIQARTLVPFFRKHIPGQPNIMIENMPGAAGRKAVNYIYTTAKPDGLTLAAVGYGLVSGAVLGLPGVLYDLDKLIYLGSTDSAPPHVFFSLKKAGLDSLEKLRASPVRIGAQNAGHAIYVGGRLFAYLLGLKNSRMVVGFSGPELDLALEKGEVDARSNGVDTVLRRNSDDLAKGLLNVHATITIPKGKFHPRFADVPALESFTKNDKERQVLNLFRMFIYPNWPYVLPPGTPPELVKILRTAMAKAFADPGFHKEFTKLMANEPSPITGEELEAAIQELPRDPGVIALYKEFAETGPLPPR
jgi:tripartite-type tricarboxylate transporter receptor subunit TctC